jgi:hypothetical protein
MPHDEIDEKLARLRSRIQAKQSDTRDRLAAAGLLGPVEAARQAFGARLTWLRDEHGEIGREPEAGVVPAPYSPRRVDRATGRIVFTDAAGEEVRPRDEPQSRRPGGRKRKRSPRPDRRSHPPKTWHDLQGDR